MNGKRIKKYLSLTLSGILCLSLSSSTVSASAEKNSSDNFTAAYSESTVATDPEETDSDLEKAEIPEFVPEAESQQSALAEAEEKASETVLYSGSCGAQAVWELDTDGTLTISGNGSMYDFTIKVDINGDSEEWDMDPKYGEAQTPWSAYLSAIKKVVIEPGITTIGKGAFMNCKNLRTVEVRALLSSIGSYAYARDAALETVAGISNIKELPAYAFYSCKNLYSLDLNQDMTSYGMGCFHDCEKLSAIPVTEKTICIDHYAFSGCRSLENATISSSIQKFGESAFQYCSNLKEIHFPDNLKFIPRNCFYYCTSLTELKLPDELETIHAYAFDHCEGLTSLTIPGSVSTLKGDKQFYNCINLKKIIFEEGPGNAVIRLVGNAFAGCLKLEDIIIPESCTNYRVVDGCLLSPDLKTALAIPAGRNGGIVRIPDTVETIGPQAICNTKGSTYILPASVKLMNTYAVYYSSNLILRFEGDAPAYNTQCFIQSNITIQYPEEAEGWSFKPQSGTVKMESYNSKSRDLAECTMILKSPAIVYSGEIPEMDARLIYQGTELSVETDYHLSVTCNSNYKPAYVKNGILHLKARTAGIDSIYGGCCDRSFMVCDSSMPVTAENAASGIKLSWTSDSKAIGYYIYRRGTSTEWTKIAAVIGSSKNSYYDKTAVSTFCYYYCVIPYNKSGSYTGSFHYLSCGTTKGNTYVERPMLSSVTNKSSGVSLKWNTVSDADGYCIMRKNPEDSSWKVIKKIPDLNTTSWVDTSAISGEVYNYNIKAYYTGRSGKIYYSIYSSVGKTICYLAMPTVSSVASARDGIKISWTPVEGVTGYYIYRRTPDTESWERFRIIVNPNAASTTDKTVTKGQKYYYTVAAYVNKGGSYYTSSKGITGKAATWS